MRLVPVALLLSLAAPARAADPSPGEAVVAPQAPPPGTPTPAPGTGQPPPPEGPKPAPEAQPTPSQGAAPTSATSGPGSTPAPPVAADAAQPPAVKKPKGPPIPGPHLDLPLHVLAGGVAVSTLGLVVMRHALAWNNEKAGLGFSDAEAARSTATSQLRAGQVILGVGAAGVAAGTGLLIYKLVQGKAPARAAVVPVPGGAVLTAGGSF